MKLKPFLLGFGIVAVLFTLAPIIATDYWWIRMLDFPHTQLTILTMVALVVYFARFDIKSWKDYAFVAILTACFIFQLSKIYPYLPHNEFEVGEASEDADPTKVVRFFAANVLQENENSDLLVRELKIQNPDIILLTETNQIWKENLTEAISEFPYKVEVPMQNTYGMLLYSKLPLKNPKINFLVDDSIPSIETRVRLNSGSEFQLFAIHPTPPMPQHNPSSTDRDAEMMIIAKKARASKLPVVVAGDFNDVAWSGTTGLFKTVGGLLDVRVGRGFYNTFDANSFVLRWPLDHFFVTEEFRVVECKAINTIDSDHFPFFITLSLEPEYANMQRPASPTKEQIIRANIQITEARNKHEEERSKKD
ncbi:endonuclease/exonuclease/phosphatase family protein [Autumnicola edwardsiae]|uniref:Endonuclease/exonuclease/phosphatase family protein n=1 Tax=Autumnicola edwardsiae TaxID=3075594 RepID=A0ABU3CSX5_9FLAO|nr:endonuclease/exonuclease/phosphatase family protein [Zunongwangia sp. F297]MDT0649333.1 endonuclease/exonuclease/phosphatase family protein [Zunongwangia sp. F297]